MSRSYKKHPQGGGITSARSEKKFKRETHQVFRAKERTRLMRALDGLEKDLQDLPRKNRDAVNPWSGPKDGKSWYNGRWYQDIVKNKKTREYHKLIGK